MGATTTIKMNVSYDDRIRQTADLFENIREAQAYFEDNYPPPEGTVLKAPPQVKWAWSPNGTDFPIFQTFVEVADSLPELEIRNRWKQSEFRDPSVRNFLVLGLLRSVLQERVRRRSEKIDRSLSQLNREESNGDV